MNQDLKQYDKFVRVIVNKFINNYDVPYYYPKDEMVADAYIGIWKALDSHDPKRGPLHPHLVVKGYFFLLDQQKDKLRKILQKKNTMSLDLIIGGPNQEEEESKSKLVDLITNPKERDFIRDFIDEEDWERFGNYFNGRERDLFFKYFKEGYLLKDIGEQWGVTATAVWMVKKKIVTQLKEYFGEGDS